MSGKVDLEFNKGLLLPCNCYSAGTGSYDYACCCSNNGASITRHPTLRAVGASENESLKRRLLELELRYGARVDNSAELQVLQSENNHFRELTYARLAEVEYWKKLYTNEKQSFEEKAEALRKEFEFGFDQEITRLTRLLSAAPSASFHSEQKIWSEKVSQEKTILMQERANLEKLYQEKLAQLNSGQSLAALQQEKAALESQLREKVKVYEDSENSIKLRLAAATKEEVTKVLTRDYEYMQLMNSDILALKQAVAERDAIIARLRQDLTMRKMQILQVPVSVDIKTQTPAPPVNLGGQQSSNSGGQQQGQQTSQQQQGQQGQQGVPPPLDLAAMLGGVKSAEQQPSQPVGQDERTLPQSTDLLALFQQSLQKLQAQVATTN